jgi:WhiB family redox-sensing transcriptional regulator
MRRSHTDVPPTCKDVNRKVNLSWRQSAACRGVDPEIFYPASEEEAVVAKSICAQCNVRQACLEYSLANRERDGVWGGATERERRRIVRQRRKSA